MCDIRNWTFMRKGFYRNRNIPIVLTVTKVLLQSFVNVFVRALKRGKIIFLSVVKLK